MVTEPDPDAARQHRRDEHHRLGARQPDAGNCRPRPTATAPAAEICWWTGCRCGNTHRDATRGECGVTEFVVVGGSAHDDERLIESDARWRPDHHAHDHQRRDDRPAEAGSMTPGCCPAHEHAARRSVPRWPAHRTADPRDVPPSTRHRDREHDVEADDGRYRNWRGPHVRDDHEHRAHQAVDRTRGSGVRSGHRRTACAAAAQRRGQVHARVSRMPMASSRSRPSRNNDNMLAAIWVRRSAGTPR